MSKQQQATFKKKYLDVYYTFRCIRIATGILTVALCTLSCINQQFLGELPIPKNFMIGLFAVFWTLLEIGQSNLAEKLRWEFSLRTKHYAWVMLLCFALISKLTMTISISLSAVDDLIQHNGNRQNTMAIDSITAYFRREIFLADSTLKQTQKTQSYNGKIDQRSPAANTIHIFNLKKFALDSTLQAEIGAIRSRPKSDTEHKKDARKKTAVILFELISTFIMLFNAAYRNRSNRETIAPDVECGNENGNNNENCGDAVVEYENENGNENTGNAGSNAVDDTDNNENIDNIISQLSEYIEGKKEGREKNTAVVTFIKSLNIYSENRRIELYRQVVIRGFIAQSSLYRGLGKH